MKYNYSTDLICNTFNNIISIITIFLKNWQFSSTVFYMIVNENVFPKAIILGVQSVRGNFKGFIAYKKIQFKQL